jgi:hypothetical protein
MGFPIAGRFFILKKLIHLINWSLLMADPVPPNNIDAERALLGSTLILPNLFVEMAATIKPEYFYVIRHRYIWESMRKLSEQGIQVDYLTLSNALQTSGLLKQVGGYEYLIQLVQETPTSMHADSYARIVKEKAYKRKLTELSRNLLQSAYSGNSLPEGIKQMEDIFISLSAFSGNTERLVFSAEQLCSSNVGELIWVLKDWIMAGGINLIAGMPAAGKSFLALDLAIGMTTSGLAWDNQPVTKGKVLYQFLDGSYRGMRSRVIKLCNARCIEPPTDLIFDFSPLNLKATAEVLALRQRIKQLGISMVIFDVMAKFAPGADENSVAEISPLMNALREIANQMGTTFLLIHHLNKGTSTDLSYRVRGSTDILGSVDTAIVVNYENSNAANSTRVIQPQKVREAEPPKPLRFQIISTDQSISLQFSEGESKKPFKTLGQQEQILLDLLNFLNSKPDQEFLKQDLIQTLHLPEDSRTMDRAFGQLLQDSRVLVLKRGSFKTYQWKTDTPDKPIS